MTDTSLEQPTPPLVTTKPNVLKTMKKEITMFIVLVGLVVLTAILNPTFLSGDNLRNNLRHISLISLFALGEAIVIIAGGIDLSIGSIICIGAVATSYMAMMMGMSIRVKRYRHI